MCTTSSVANSDEGRSPASCVSRSNRSGIELAPDDLNGARAAVDDSDLAGPQASSCIARADHRGDAVLTRDKRGVRGQRAAIGHDRGGALEERRPGRRSYPSDEDFAWFKCL